MEIQKILKVLLSEEPNKEISWFVQKLENIDEIEEYGIMGVFDKASQAYTYNNYPFNVIQIVGDTVLAGTRTLQLWGNETNMLENLKPIGTVLALGEIEFKISIKENS